MDVLFELSRSSSNFEVWTPYVRLLFLNSTIIAAAFALREQPEATFLAFSLGFAAANVISIFYSIWRQDSSPYFFDSRSKHIRDVSLQIIDMIIGLGFVIL